MIVVVALAATAQAPRAMPLTRGMVIDRSITVRAGTYRLAASGDQPVLTIRGNNITVDFSGAVLAGSAADADPDTFDGVAMLIDGGRNVTIKNAVVRGYKVAVLARRAPDLRITASDFSYNYKPRLYSGIEKESLVDWMSYHQNDKDEWLTRGAAIYLAECDRAEIDRNTILQGQNGVMATRSTGVKIWNNTIQFMSGIGIGLYRITGSTVAHNRIDFCVRGYSHGFYNRGQDSAGLLMYEQSSRNKVFNNSITHGGDGLFLWAGQSTMDTGNGGSNNNLFYRNDFSHAATNGIEATFSSNTFVNNRVEECWHGVWAGYSYRSSWSGNKFARNTEAMAIEHGQDNLIQANTFDGDGIGVRLWQNPSQDPAWGYPKTRDTRSRGYYIFDNTFTGTKVALDIRATANVEAPWNRFRDVTRRLSGDASVDLDSRPASLKVSDFMDVPPLVDGIDPMIEDSRLRGRDRIIVDEWGPYDWRSPKLWPRGRPDQNPLPLRVLGPKGHWTVISSRGASVSAKSGEAPAEIAVTPAVGPLVDFDLRLEYRGEEVVSPRGARTPAGKPYAFGYSRFFVPIDWTIKFAEYDGTSDPITAPAAFLRALASPIKTVATSRLDYMSGRTIEEGVPADHFALDAEGTATVPPGDYTVQVISDDGVRVWMDGTLILDEWAAHESKVNRVAIRGGRRHFKVQYYDVRGFAELRFDIQRK